MGEGPVARAWVQIRALSRRMPSGTVISVVKPEAIDDVTQARFDDQMAQHVEQLRVELDLNARANAALAVAAGLDVSGIPQDSLRELAQVSEQVSKAEPPPLPRE